MQTNDFILAFAGLAVLPVAGLDGFCNDNNPIGYQVPQESECKRQVVANKKCAADATAFDMTSVQLGMSVDAVPGAKSK